MERRPSNDRARERKNADHKQFDAAREDFSQQQSGQIRDVKNDRPTPEDPEAFRKHMEEKLKESGKNTGHDK